MGKGEQVNGLRVLGRLRISRETTESTSISRQREIVQQWADANSHTVVGWAVDEGVSGAVDAFDTPALGDWLNNRADEFEVICAWKLDRLGRNATQLNKLFGWCQEYNKTLVCVSDNIDLSSWVGRLVANVIAGLAEGELENTRDRVRASRAKLRTEARWPGGRPPYGYRTVRNRAGDGWTLEVDEAAAVVVRRIAKDVLAGKSLNSVATALNAEKVLAPTEHYRKETGKPVGSSKWRQAPMKLMLRSKALLGFVHYKGEVIRDDAGAPIRMADELISLEDYNRVQAVLDGVEARYTTVSRDPSPLSGLVFCHVCGSGLRFSVNTVHGRRYGYYRHPAQSDCSMTVLIPVGDMQSRLEEVFLYVLGDEPIKERVWQPGDSREAELQEAVTAFDELSQTAGRLTSQTAKARLQAQLSALDERIAELEAAPRVEGGYRWVEVGGTYGDAYRAADVNGRRELLRRSGITVAVAVEREGRRSKYNGGSWLVDVRIPEGLMSPEVAGRYEVAAAAARQEWGIPDD